MSSSTPILVVEDEANIRDAVCLALEDEGYQVDAAVNGSDALGRLQTNELPRLILLDLVMPVMDGWKFRRAQQQAPALADIPVVLVSGAADLSQQAVSLRAVGFLQKPFDFDKLLDLVHRHVDPQRPQVLVVDDEALIRKLLSRMLNDQGLTALLAASGEEAIDLYRKHGARIALVLLDVQLPGLNGPQTLAALQQLNPDVRCCFMSGDTGAYSIPQLLATGALRFLSKPFLNLAEVKRTLSQLIQAN